MQKISFIYGFMLLMLLTTAQSALADQNKLEGLRMWPSPEQTRLVFDISAPVEHKIFILERPDRVVIDMKNIDLVTDLGKHSKKSDLLKRIRSAQRDNDRLRVVLDLNEKVKAKSYLLKPTKEYGHRLVVEIDPKNTKKSASKTVNNLNKGARDIIIAIDAGHGGEDPGAVGPNRVYEKDVVLDIARQLKVLLEKEKGIRAELIRDGDYFLRLRKRVQKARALKADLMISIHADSFSDRSVDGASIYTLSPRGATSEQARRLAEKENNSDLIGGVSLDDKDDLLASVLLDLSQTATIEVSTDIATRVLKRLKRIGRIHKKEVGQAAFMVLKSPDVPSILIETAFISNPKEERKLRSRSHQKKLANEIKTGVLAYYKNNPPPGTLLSAMAARKHVISRGDTLSGIAQQYQISMNLIKQVNKLKSSSLKVGKVLQIPQI
jgi:N-acetylmuramoyl-L-alanine amidase